MKRVSGSSDWIRGRTFSANHTTASTFGLKLMVPSKTSVGGSLTALAEV